MQDRKKKHEVRRITEFGTIGAVVAALSFVQLWLYIDVMGMPFWLAYIVQTIVSVQLSFFGNYLVTWRDRELRGRFMKAYGLFWATRGVMIFVNPVIFAVLTVLGVHYLLAQFIVLAVNTVINYVLGDKIIFRQSEAKETA